MPFMSRPLFVAVAASLLLLSVVPPTVSFDAPPEEIFTWHAQGEEGMGSGATPMAFCTIMTDGANPCDLRDLHIGNDDEAVYLRWTAATLQFADVAPEAALLISQTFHGSQGQDETFSIRAIIGATGDDPVWTSVAPSDWKSAVEWKIDRAAGTLTARLPLEQLASKLAQGAYATEWFNVTSDTAMRGTALYLDGEGAPGECNTGDPTGSDANACKWSTVDFIRSSSFPDNGTFTLKPVGSLAAPPSTIEEQYPGLGSLVTLTFDEPTWDTYVFRIDLDVNSTVFNHSAEVENGTAILTLVDPENNTVVEGELETGSVEDPLEGMTPGGWNLTLSFDAFVGTVTFVLAEPPEEEQDVDGEAGEGESGNETEGETEPERDIQDKDTPAPAVAVVLAVLLGLLARVRRRD